VILYQLKLSGVGWAARPLASGAPSRLFLAVHNHRLRGLSVLRRPAHGWSARTQSKNTRSITWRSARHVIRAKRTMALWLRHARPASLLASNPMPSGKSKSSTGLPLAAKPCYRRVWVRRQAIKRLPSAVAAGSKPRGLTLPSRGRLPGYALQPPLMSNVRRHKRPVVATTLTLYEAALASHLPPE
jgi:hypothetical protein